MQQKLFPDYADYNPDSPVFDNFQYQATDLSNNKITVKRLNDLFQSGVISAKEHSFLVETIHPYKPEKRISLFAIGSLVTAAVNWILLLKFEFGGEVYQLLTGQGRLTAGTILAPLSVILFCFAVVEMRHKDNVKGYSIGIAGLAIALVILTIVIPVKILE